MQPTSLPSVKFPSVAQCALLLAVFLGVVSGGQVPSDSVPLSDSPILAALTGDPAVPLLTVGLMAVLVTIAGISAFLQRRVVQFPALPVAVSCGLFLVSLLVSIFWSGFRGVGIGASTAWLTYAATFFVGVIVLGRKQGPMLLLATLLAAGTVVSLKGILEYGDMKWRDPTWRIFAGWVNPNATAAVLMVCFFAGVGCLTQTSRLSRLVSAIATTLIMVAIYLTQSKGALLCLGVGIVGFVIFAAITAGNLRKIALAGIGICAILGFALGVVMTRPPAGNGPVSLGRIASSSNTQEQSAGFRQALWKGTIQLIKERPQGFGLGTYRHESARPGITTQTVYAHNAYLQIAAEAGVAATGILAGFLGLWLTVFLKGSRKQTPEIAISKAAIFAAVLAVLSHCLVDSDLYYPGIGVAVFALLAAGILLASDGVTPELIPGRLRGVSITALALFALITQYPAVNEALRGQARDAVRRQDIDGARSAAAAAAMWMPVDGDAPYLLAKLSQSTSERDAYLRLAVENAPSTRNQRALATNLAQSGDRAAAITVLDSALRRDENNLLTLKLLLQIQRDSQDLEAAKQTAERLVAVEQTDYYKVRSLPEIVPTETAEAREFLASMASNRAEQIALLKPALAIYQEYLAHTWPMVDRATKDDASANIGDENRPGALLRLENGKRIADRLADLYRETGDGAGAGEAATAAVAFRDVLAK